MSERLMSVTEITTLTETACAANAREWREQQESKHYGDLAEVTVYRTGTFTVAAPEVEGKCGVFGKQEFKYEAWFTATENDLDSRGFVVDNADLNRYFLQTYSLADGKFVSCERMCLTAMRDWRTRWQGMATEIVVRVWGMTDVTYVETRWRKR